MSRKSGTTWWTHYCPSCNEIHMGYSGKVDSDGNEYVVCGRTNDKCRVRDVPAAAYWHTQVSCASLAFNSQYPRSYAKLPVQVEAMMWTGFNYDEIAAFCGDFVKRGNTSNVLIVNTREGAYTIAAPYIIIKGVEGEFYPCEPDIFFKTYI